METTGNQNVTIGANANANMANLTNSSAIGYGITLGGSNQIMFGNNATTRIGSYQTWTTFHSDENFMRNVRKNVGGLDFILELRPVNFQVDALEMAKQLYPAPADTILTDLFVENLRKSNKK